MTTIDTTPLPPSRDTAGSTTSPSPNRPSLSPTNMSSATSSSVIRKRSPMGGPSASDMDVRPLWGSSRDPKRSTPPRTRSGRMVTGTPPPLTPPSRPPHTSDRTLVTPEPPRRARKGTTPDGELSTTSASIIGTTSSSSMGRPLPLAKLLRGSLYCRTYRMALATSTSRFPHLLGRFSEHVFLSVFLRYVNEEGMMDLKGWLRFYKESGLLLTHCPHNEEGDIMDQLGSDLEPERLFRTMLFMQGRMEERTVTLGHFWSLICRVSKVVFPRQYQADPGDALDRMMKEVILPLYMLSGRGRIELSKSQPLGDQRIFLLLTDYASNLWRVFRVYAHDPLGRAPPENKVFPHDAQNSERNLAVLVSGVPQVLPGRENHRESFSSCYASYDDSAIFCISQQCFIRFAEEYGLCPILLTKARLREIFGSTVDQRRHEGDLWPAYVSPWTNNQVKDPTLTLALTASRIINKLHNSSKGTTSSFTNDTLIANNLTTSDSNPGQYFPQDLASFSEFQQMLVEVALEGLGKPNYHSLFPTSYSKVAALLVDFNVANMNKLAQVRQMRSTKADPFLIDR